MKHLAAVLTMLTLCSAAAAADSGMGALQRFVGDWAGAGSAVDSAQSRAGSLSGQTHCELARNQAFVVCSQIGHYKALTQLDVTVFSYDSSKQKYSFYNIRQDSANSTHLDYDGRGTFTFGDSYKDDAGKTVYTRTLNTFTDANHYTWRTEFSYDQATWTLMNSGIVHRV